MSYCIRCAKAKLASEMKSEKICLLCANKRKHYYRNNSNIIKEKSKVYYKNNNCYIKNKAKERYLTDRFELLNWQKQYYYNNIEARKQYNEKYYEKHKKEIVKKVMLYTKQRKKIDPVFKLRKRVSGDIWRMLKLNNSSKNNKSCGKYLSYSIQQLKDHLESLFEAWMNWNNWGVYNLKNWNDNDQSTWTWQIDHIIPHSVFKYSSMEDEAFKQCWALNNLQPLKSKENIKKGNRH